MRAAEFDRLCDELAVLLGTKAAQLEERKSGLWVLPLPIDGDRIYLLHAPDVDAHAASIVVEFGALPSDCEFSGLLDLLEANRTFHGSFTPRFARDPETGEVLLQFTFRLHDISAEVVYSKIMDMILMAREWRERYTRPRAP